MPLAHSPVKTWVKVPISHDPVQKYLQDYSPTRFPLHHLWLTTIPGVPRLLRPSLAGNDMLTAQRLHELKSDHHYFG